MTDAPLILKTGSTTSSKVQVCVGEDCALIPRHLLQTISFVRFPGNTGIEGKDCETQEWRDLTQHGATRRHFI